MSWTLNFSQIKPLYVAYPYCEELTEAFNERAKVVGLSTLAIPQKLSFIYNWAIDFENGITNMFPLFANHNYNNGDYTELNVIPSWTESDMLTQIGASSRIKVKHFSVFSADWAKQQYDILNQLLWTFENLTVNNVTGGGGLRRGSGSSFSQAVSSWNSASWQSASDHQEIEQSASNGIFGIDVTRRRIVDATLALGFPSGILINKTITLYSMFEKKATNSPTYENPDYTGANSNGTMDIVGINNTPNTDYTMTITVGDFSTITIHAPSGDWNGWIQPSNPYYPVYKWNVSGGFNKQP